RGYPAVGDEGPGAAVPPAVLGDELVVALQREPVHRGLAGLHGDAPLGARSRHLDAAAQRDRRLAPRRRRLAGDRPLLAVGEHPGQRLEHLAAHRVRGVRTGRDVDGRGAPRQDRHGQHTEHASSHDVHRNPSCGPARTTVAGTVAAVTDPREPTIVADHHCRRGWGSARDVGARAAAQNLADVVAMGAVPTSMVVGTVLPPTTPLEWVLDLARGLADVCAPLGVGVDGGDLSAGEQVVVAVTVHGDLEGRAPVLRSGARPGDVVAHAGAIGRATAGYAVLATGSTSDDPEAAVAVGAFLRPTP